MHTLASFTFSLLLALTAFPAASQQFAPKASADSNTCTGSYNATIRNAGCSNSFSVSDSMVVTGLNLALPGPIQGSVTLSGFMFSGIPRLDGSCAVKPNTSSSMTLALSGAWNGSTGSITLTAPEGAQASGTFTVANGTQLSGSVSQTSVARNWSSSFNCRLPDLDTLALVIGMAGNGAGSGSSSPAGINCGATCSAKFNRGATVKLTPIPAAGSYFAGWTGACTGRTACSVKMDGVKGVKAGFRLKPFEVAVSGGIPATRATVKTTIQFNAGDVGKTGSVFVTATVPARALGTVLKKSARTPANADRMADGDGVVLVQLTSSGWETVEDGQLSPYTTGVLGETQSAQTILNETETTDLQGAEFCMGYGASGTEMTSAGRMVSVATIPASDGTSASSGTCLVDGATNYTGLWWNQAESGWGISLTQQEATVFAAWYTYDQVGAPTWFVMSSCPVIGTACSGDIYKVVGGTPPGVPWNGAGKVVTKVGSGSFSFADIDTMAFTYSLDGVNGTKNLTRQVFATGTVQPTVDYSALWWNAAEPGWGLALTQEYAMIFVTMYTYDAAGKPVWYVASSCPVTGDACSGDLYQVTGGTAPNLAWNEANKLVSKVGTTRFVFTGQSTGTMDYTINGASGSKAITRQPF